MTDITSENADKPWASMAVSDSAAGDPRFATDTARILQLFSDLQESDRFRAVFGEANAYVDDIPVFEPWINPSPSRNVGLRAGNGDLDVSFRLDIVPDGLLPSLKITAENGFEMEFEGYSGQDDLQTLIDNASHIVFQQAEMKTRFDALGVRPEALLAR